MPELQGKKFRALRRLSDRDNHTLAAVGETCARVPAASLPGLLTSGKIAPLTRRRRGEGDGTEDQDER